MSSITKFLIKNTELILYLSCFLVHAVFAPIFRHYGFSVLFTYNMIVAILYGIFVVLLSNSHKRFFLNLAYIEILIYTLTITILTGADFGTRYYAICIIPALFFFVYNEKSSHRYYIILSVISVVITFIIIWWEFIRPRAIFSGFMTAVTIYKDLYRIHVVVSTSISIALLYYLSIVTITNLSTQSDNAHKQALQLDYMANHDQLTGLINRRKISTLFKKCQYSHEKSGKDYAIAIFDLDNFKSVNDTYGHDAGDFILCRISSLVASMLPENSTMARWGGEEFIIVFEEYRIDVIHTLDTIRKTVEKSTNLWKDLNIKITLTFGLSSSRAAETPDKIIIDADNRLFYGKQNGKNRVCVSEKY